MHVPLFNARNVTCEDAGCSEKLQWQNGQYFEYTPELGSLHVKMIGAHAHHACTRYTKGIMEITDFDCVEAPFSFVCEFDCDLNGAIGIPPKHDFLLTQI